MITFSKSTEKKRKIILEKYFNLSMSKNGLFHTNFH